MNVILEPKENLEFSIQDSLEGLGVTLLSECDVLVFVYRHGASLASADQIALFLGYEREVVAAALECLERNKLIERSRSSGGVRLHRILASTDAERQHCFQHLVSLSENRGGRLLLTKQLKRGGRNHGGARKRLSLESKGNWLCLKAI